MENFAVISTGGKQYQVSPGMKIEVEKTSAKDQAVTFDQVVAVATNGQIKIGNPIVKGATVTGKVLAEVKQAKVTSFTLRRKKNHRKKKAHRQELVLVEINSINA